MKRLFVHVPYGRLEEVKHKLIDSKISPEVYLSASDLEGHRPEEIVDDLMALRDAGLSLTIHAPFMDLNPGSVDPAVRRLTLKRWQQLGPIAEALRPQVVVVHPGFDHWRYGAAVDQWLDLASETIKELMEEYPPWVTVAVENIFEKDPWTIKALLERVNHPRVGHCFDIGHFLVFGNTDLDTWFAALGEWTVELHLHDNNGDRDAHWGMGKGIAPWDKLFSIVVRMETQPLYVIEAHTEEDALLSLDFMKRKGWLRQNTGY